MFFIETESMIFTIGADNLILMLFIVIKYIKICHLNYS